MEEYALVGASTKRKSTPASNQHTLMSIKQKGMKYTADSARYKQCEALVRDFLATGMYTVGSGCVC